MKSLKLSFVLFSSLVLPKVADPQDSQQHLLLEAILTNYDVSRTETLVYLRVFSDGLQKHIQCAKLTLER